MKPKDLYSGPAPAAQGMMGQGILEAGANIGRSIQSGNESLGKGIGAGLQAVGQAYGDYQTAKAANKMTETLLGNEEMSKKVLGIGGQERVDMLSSFRDTIGQYGQRGGAQFSQKLLTPIHEYAAIGKQYLQQQKLADISAETARMVGLSGTLAPYALGNKTPNFDPQGFLAPGFQSEAQPQTSTVMADDYAQFMKEQPDGNPQNFPIWQQERMLIRKQQAANAAKTPNFLGNPIR